MEDSQTRTGAVVEILKPQNLTKTSQTVKKDIRKYWDKEFITQRLSLITNHSHKMLLQFLWRSGVRISEAVSLQKQNIDFKNYTMTVKWLKNRKYLYRVLPLHPSLRDVLEVYTAIMKAEEKVFPITRQRAWQITRTYLNGYPHQMRHSFAVNWLRCGGDVVVLHRILGHSKLQTTMEYLKIVPVDQGKELIKISFD